MINLKCFHLTKSKSRIELMRIILMILVLVVGNMKICPNNFMQFNEYIYLSLYFVILVFMSICSFALLYFFGKGGTIQLLYSSPIVILNTVFFFS